MIKTHHFIVTYNKVQTWHKWNNLNEITNGLIYDDQTAANNNHWIRGSRLGIRFNIFFPCLIFRVYHWQMEPPKELQQMKLQQDNSMTKEYFWLIILVYQTELPTEKTRLLKESSLFVTPYVYFNSLDVANKTQLANFGKTQTTTKPIKVQNKTEH